MDNDGIGNACDWFIPVQFLPPSRVGKYYVYTLTVVRSQPPYSCTLVSGSLSGGLTLWSDCTIRGWVTAERLFVFLSLSR